MSAIVVCSGKGSPGGTFVAVNLAAALARAKQNAVLLDLDPAGGELCCYLGLDPRRGLFPLLRMEGSVSGPSRLLAEAEERSGFHVVGGFPEASELATPDVLAGALAAARAPDRVIVADIGRVTTTNAAHRRAGGIGAARRAGGPRVGARSRADTQAAGGSGSEPGAYRCRRL